MLLVKDEALRLPVLEALWNIPNVNDILIVLESLLVWEKGWGKRLVLRDKEGYLVAKIF